jgi:hypothetical protein|tara:strand:- start:72 stop:503 length:432 start_codon:yes stop_codon:yes gene_type:complete
LASAQQTVTLNLESDNAAVRNQVEQFLTAAGNYDLDAMPQMFSEKANIGGASLKDVKWNSFTLTIQEFLDFLKSQKEQTKYTQPISNYTIQIDGGMLAFVKADAVLLKNGKPQATNFDYFTLIKHNGEWNILNGSYVSIPIEN